MDAARPSRAVLLLSDLTANVIYKWTPKGVSVYLDKAGYSGTDINNAGTQTKRGRVAVIMIGPNGEALDPQGRLVWCASPDGTIVRLEKDGTRTVLADKYEGKRFNGPNDIAIRSDGAIYFTDSDFGLRGSSKSPQKELTFNGVYLVKDGKTTLLIDDKTLGGFPNGITLSPDEKYLYLTLGFKKMMRYELKSDGTLGDGSTFFEGGEGIVDGMKTDRDGQPVFHRRRRPWCDPHQLAGGQAPGHDPSADLAQGAAAADLRHERGVRRCGRQEPLHHRLHGAVPNSDDNIPGSRLRASR